MIHVRKNMTFCSSHSLLNVIREGVKKNRIYLGLCPKHRTPPTHRARLRKSRKKSRFFFTIFGALKHFEMARYDLPTYVLHVLGHFWMFAVNIAKGTTDAGVDCFDQ